MQLAQLMEVRLRPAELFSEHPSQQREEATVRPMEQELSKRREVVAVVAPIPRLPVAERRPFDAVRSVECS